MRTCRQDRSIAPVIGTVLMVALVVVFALFMAVVFAGFSEQLNAPPPFAADEQSVEVEVGPNETSHALEFVHRSGQTVDTSGTEVVISVGNSTERIPLSEIDDSALDDSSWTAGEHVSIDLNESTVCAPGVESTTVELVHSESGQSYTLSSRSIPIERGQFVIEGSEVRATTDYTANVKFVGTGWSSADGSSDPPVNVTVHVGDSRVHAWRLIRDSATVVGSYGVSRQESGTSVEIRAAGRYCGWACQRGWADPQWRRVSSTENTENVRVYRDGDDAPDFDTVGGQEGVAEYLDPYVENGTITLDDNQAIYLFDFNEDDHDYQDAVVLVSFFTRQEETMAVHESRSRSVVLCPAETRSASPTGGTGP